MTEADGTNVFIHIFLVEPLILGAADTNFEHILDEEIKFILETAEMIVMGGQGCKCVSSFFQARSLTFDVQVHNLSAAVVVLPPLLSPSLAPSALE